MLWFECSLANFPIKLAKIDISFKGALRVQCLNAQILPVDARYSCYHMCIWSSVRYTVQYTTAYYIPMERTWIKLLFHVQYGGRLCEIRTQVAMETGIENIFKHWISSIFHSNVHILRHLFCISQYLEANQKTFF